MENGNLPLILGLYAAGLLAAGLAAAFCSAGKAERHIRLILLSAAFGLPLAFLGAKLFFLLHNLGLDLRNWKAEDLLSVWWENLSFSGGCVGFSCGVLIAAKCCGIPGKKALDAFALPACILIFFARLAEAGMDEIGLGGDLPAFLPAVWPFGVEDDWGFACLAVYPLEALAAAVWGVCLFVTRKKAQPDGLRFQKTVFVLASAQLCLEMLVSSGWIPFVISFIHLEQVVCAIALMTVMIRWCLRIRKVLPALLAALLLGLNALMQLAQDKPYLFAIPAGTNIRLLAFIVFALLSAGLIVLGLRTARRVTEKE